GPICERADAKTGGHRAPLLCCRPSLAPDAGQTSGRGSHLATPNRASPLMSSAQVRLRLTDQLAECVCIMHGQIRQHLAVDLDAGALEAVHEARVVELLVVLTDRRVDAGDPQATELALPLLAVTIRVRPSTLDRVLRNPPQLRAATEVATSRAEIALLLAVPRH